jgi:DNA-directed RNA polymerase subunit alpha
MGIKWKDFQFPKQVVLDQASATSTYGKFIAEPFERGFGVTLGNVFRRVLLSSIEGAAVTSIRIIGVQHEFTAVDGVLEDVTEIVMNVKQLVLRMNSRMPKRVTLKANKAGELRAKDIQTDDTIEIINKDLLICTLTKDVKFEMELEISKGRGFVAESLNRQEDAPIGTIAIDSIFTPVRKVNFKVESTRVGKSTDYDSLILEVETDGSIEPKEAVLYAAAIFQKHLELFRNLGEIVEENEEDLSQEELSLYEKLKLPVSELELSVRSANCLREANIKTLYELVTKSEAEMLGFRNFGKKSLSEIDALLKTMGLYLGMQVEKDKLEKV